MSDPNSPLVRLRTAVRQLASEVRDRPLNGRGHEDADDVHGTMATDDAVGFDPEPLLRRLFHHRARVVVIGQVAGIMHGSCELTGDLDLLWDGTREQAPRLAAAFAEVGADIFDEDGNPLACAAASFLLARFLSAPRTRAATAAPLPCRGVRCPWPPSSRAPLSRAL
ncbi:MAG: hypothetical protein JWR83_2544, partial [Aeromicrobium sp.]|nr:hypothetical protein [Aeromicrobium sp.]